MAVGGVEPTVLCRAFYSLPISCVIETIFSLLVDGCLVHWDGLTFEHVPLHLADHSSATYRGRLVCLLRVLWL